jgi:hypothetical protein
MGGKFTGYSRDVNPDFSCDFLARSPACGVETRHGPVQPFLKHTKNGFHRPADELLCSVPFLRSKSAEDVTGDSILTAI